MNPLQLSLPLDEFLARAPSPGIPRPRRDLLQPQPADERASRGSGSTWTTRSPSTTSRRWTSCRSRRRIEKLVARGYPDVHRAHPLRHRLPRARPAHRQAVRPHPQDGPLQVRDEGLPRLPRALEGRAPRRSTTRRRSARRRRATTGSTRSTRSARRPLYAALVEALEQRGLRASTTRKRLHRHPREHRRGAPRRDDPRAPSLGDYPRFVDKDPDLAPTLHKLRSAGKKLFLLTNSRWAYTDRMMTLPPRRRDGASTRTWRNYFDVVIVAATKPAFFQERRPLMERDGDESVRPAVFPLERGQDLRGRQPAGARARARRRAATRSSTSATTSTATSCASRRRARGARR